MADGLPRIPVVDDKGEIRCLVSKILSRMGYEVLSTDNGDKGLNLFMNNRFDFVVTDIDMPGMDGWSLALHIKEKSPCTPAILMTVHGKNDILDKFHQSPADQILFKPFGYNEFEEEIQKNDESLGN